MFSSSDDYVAGFEGDDKITVWWGTDDILGGDGNDILQAFNSSATVNGNAGNDTITVMSFQEQGFAYGDEGNDEIDVADGDTDDSVECGPGTDTVTYDDPEPSTSGVADSINVADDCEIKIPKWGFASLAGRSVL